MGLITVTQDDIYLGCRFQSENCPIALALQRAFPNSRVRAYSLMLWVKNDLKQYMRWIPPESVTTFIRNFDRGLPVAPFSFEIGEPDSIDSHGDF